MPSSSPAQQPRPVQRSSPVQQPRPVQRSSPVQLPSPDLLTSLTFRLGLIGARIEARYSLALAPERVKPKHVAMLALLRAGVPASQLEIATRMQVAPSLVVTLADQLEQLGALARERDPQDRRRQRLALTPAGEDLLDRCGAIIAALDAELVRLLDADTAALEHGIARLAVGLGLPDTGTPQPRA